jgi:hypothetical protein
MTGGYKDMHGQEHTHIYRVFANKHDLYIYQWK